MLNIQLIYLKITQTAVAVNLELFGILCDWRKESNMD